jgi:hypothetical protein
LGIENCSFTQQKILVLKLGLGIQGKDAAVVVESKNIVGNTCRRELSVLVVIEVETALSFAQAVSSSLDGQIIG